MLWRFNSCEEVGSMATRQPLAQSNCAQVILAVKTTYATRQLVGDDACGYTGGGHQVPRSLQQARAAAALLPPPGAWRCASAGLAAVAFAAAAAAGSVAATAMPATAAARPVTAAAATAAVTAWSAAGCRGHRQPATAGHRGHRDGRAAAAKAQ